MTQYKVETTSSVSGKIFAVMSVVSIGLMVFYIYLSLNFIPKALALKPKDFHDFPVFSENVWLPMVSATGFGILRYLSKLLLTPLVKPYVKD